MNRKRFLTSILLAASLLMAVTAARANDPYLHSFTVNPGELIDFTVEQYNGDSTAPADFVASWSGNTGVNGSLGAALWRRPNGTYSHMQLNDVDLSADSTIGPTDWFYMNTSLGQTRVQAQVRDLNIQDAGVPGNSDLATDGSFLLPDYQSLLSGYLDVYLQYKLFIVWINVPDMYPRTENLADYNDPPPQNDMDGTVTGSGNAATLSTVQQAEFSIYLNDYADEIGATADYTINVDFAADVSAPTQGTPTLLLHANAGSDTTVYGIYADGSLDGSASYDPQDDSIVEYRWDLDGDGDYDDKSSVSSAVSDADLTALSMGFGDHTVGLKITADDGYWATDEITLTYLPSYAADFNIDGAVDVTDLGILATNYDASGKTWTEGDANLDGLVNISDLGILATNYGIGTAVAAVPEPATLSLVGLGIGMLLMIRRRR